MSSFVRTLRHHHLIPCACFESVVIVCAHTQISPSDTVRLESDVIVCAHTQTSLYAEREREREKERDAVSCHCLFPHSDVTICAHSGMLSDVIAHTETHTDVTICTQTETPRHHHLITCSRVTI
eukprot:794081-Rhodomonas_salina.1